MEAEAASGITCSNRPLFLLYCVTPMAVSPRLLHSFTLAPAKTNAWKASTLPSLAAAIMGERPSTASRGGAHLRPGRQRDEAALCRSGGCASFRCSPMRTTGDASPCASSQGSRPSGRHAATTALRVVKASSSELLCPSCSSIQPPPHPEGDDLDGTEARCSYILAHTPCAPAGYIDYLRIFHCGFGAAPAAIGYAAVLLWLVLLFYLIGDIASESFYASLESRSARRGGVTLLSLGNGASDVFGSVVSFAAGEGRGGGVGLNNALGGTLFVSTGRWWPSGKKMLLFFMKFSRTLRLIGELNIVITWTNQKEDYSTCTKSIY
ncbi:hypothetical protein ACQ4PT_027171 [Festuca glaucescens]